MSKLRFKRDGKTLRILPDESTVIPYQRLYQKHYKGVETLIIEEGITDIQAEAFQDCTDITSLQLPSSLQTLGSFAFYMCESLQDVTLHPGVQMGEDVFSPTTEVHFFENPPSHVSFATVEGQVVDLTLLRNAVSALCFGEPAFCHPDLPYDLRAFRNSQTDELEVRICCKTQEFQFVVPFQPDMESLFMDYMGDTLAWAREQIKGQGHVQEELDYIAAKKAPVYDFSYDGISVTPEVIWQVFEEARTSGEAEPIPDTPWEVRWYSDSNTVTVYVPYCELSLVLEDLQQPAILAEINTLFYRFRELAPELKVFQSLEEELPKIYTEYLVRTIQRREQRNMDKFSIAPGKPIQWKQFISYDGTTDMCEMQPSDMVTVLRPVVKDMAMLLDKPELESDPCQLVDITNNTIWDAAVDIAIAARHGDEYKATVSTSCYLSYSNELTLVSRLPVLNVTVPVDPTNPKGVYAYVKEHIKAVLQAHPAIYKLKDIPIKVDLPWLQKALRYDPSFTKYIAVLQRLSGEKAVHIPMAQVRLVTDKAPDLSYILEY